jgi:putative aldouronate transport system permease protein
MKVDRTSIKLFSKHIVKDRQMILMCLPAIIKIFIFSYIPMFGIIIAFKNYIPSKGILGSEWNGFKNFEFFFKSDAAWTVLRNTIGMNFIFIITGTAVSVIVALFLYEITNKHFLKVYQSIMFFPYFFSCVLIGLMLTTVIGSNGLLTVFIKNITGNNFNFYGTPGAWITILPLVNIWRGTGFCSLIYYSILMSIDKELFAAAAIDGATKFQTIKNISIPFLIPVVTLMTILAIGGIIKADFGMFYFVTKNQSALYPVTDVIDTYVYRALADNGDFGMSSAVGVFQSVVGFIMIMATNKMAKAVDKDLALF